MKVAIISAYSAAELIPPAYWLLTIMVVWIIETSGR